MHGGTPHPLDIAVVLDTTASMNSACTQQRRRDHERQLDEARLREGGRPGAAQLARPVQPDSRDLRHRRQRKRREPARRGGPLHVPGDHEPDCVHARLDEHALEQQPRVRLPGQPDGDAELVQADDRHPERDRPGHGQRDERKLLPSVPGDDGTKTVNIAYNAVERARSTTALNADQRAERQLHRVDSESAASPRTRTSGRSRSSTRSAARTSTTRSAAAPQRRRTS